MSFQQEHLPQDRPASPEQQWGFTLEQFLSDNWEYLLGIVIILAVFLYARYSWRKRYEKEKREK